MIPFFAGCAVGGLAVLGYAFVRASATYSPQSDQEVVGSASAPTRTTSLQHDNS